MSSRVVSERKCGCEVMGLKNFKEELVTMKAFSDINRLRVLAMLRQSERCACELLADLNIRQSTLSHHMKILCDSGIVDSWVEGRWTHYRISKEGSDRALELLKGILGE